MQIVQTLNKCWEYGLQFAGEKAIKDLWEDSDIGILGRFIGTAGLEEPDRVWGWDGPLAGKRSSTLKGTEASFHRNIT